MLAGDDFVRRLDDGIAFLCIEQAELDVHRGGGALHQSQRADQLHRHALAGNAEVLQAALGLRAPQAVGGDFDLAERVSLYPGACHTHLQNKQFLPRRHRDTEKTRFGKGNLRS